MAYAIYIFLIYEIVTPKNINSKNKNFFEI